MSKLSTESYKGVRDFYPEDQFIQNYIFSTMRKTVESFGYLEYSASILEPAELYKQKSGDEIVNEQTYTFKDRGDREVTLRPEMTPTVARLVAQKEKELNFPLRWYSIPNLFRYEKPQKGRLREHFQLNVDLFGLEGIEADCEIIKIAYKIMKNFGAEDKSFIVRINNRKLINALYEKFGVEDEEKRHTLSKIIDKKDKISEDTFFNSLKEVLDEKAQEFKDVISSPEKLLAKIGKEDSNVKEILDLIEKLLANGVKNTIFDPSLMRGFDYYTGMVFEIFDTNKENPRSLFGGGRFDELLSIFDKGKVPAVGFGMGDVTAKDFLQTHNLLPEYKPKTDLCICVIDFKYNQNAEQIADSLRDEGLNVVVDFTNKKLGDKIKNADRNKIPFVLPLGEEEIKKDLYKIKELLTGTETEVKIDQIKNIVTK